ncbi:MAG: hypothetical protein J5I98_15160 [Phaeodactylibacter sp.]|nr:hypothetical protein [Phaeodactylibacter sp.]
MKLMHCVPILLVLAMQPGGLISQKFQYENKYELLGEESVAHIDSLIRSRLLSSHENGGELVKMYAEQGLVQGALQFTGAEKDTVSGLLGTTFPAFCQCLKYRDTIEINNAFGLYPAGVALNFRVYTNAKQYKVEFLSGEDSDNNLIYKKHPEDEEFVSRIEDEFQNANFKLYLWEQGTDDLAIYGEFAGEVRPYYERSVDNQLKKHHYRLNALFKCAVRDIEEVLDEK